MPDIRQLDHGLGALLDEADAAFVENLTGLVRALRLRINQLVRQMGREGGHVRQTVTNLAIAQQAEQALRTALTEAGYEQIMLDAFAYLPRLTAFTGLSKQALALTEFDLASLEAFRGVKLGELGEFTDRLVNQIQQVLMKGVFGAQDERELLSELELALKDVPAHAKTIYETALSEATQTMIALKADAGPEQKFLYSGPIDMRARPFCLERVGQVFARAEIDTMDNGQLDNTFLTRGGYNCRHLWRPVSALGEYADTPSGEYAETRDLQAVEDVQQAQRDRRERTRPRVGAGT
jgi:hypothetical protein